MKRFLALGVLATAIGLPHPSYAQQVPTPAETAGRRIVRDSAGISIVENAAPEWTGAWTISPEPVLTIGAPGSDQRLSRVAGALRLPNGEIVVAEFETAEIRWFDQSGRFLRDAEFGGLAGIDRILRLPGDSIAASSARDGLLAIFGPGGGYDRTISVGQLLVAIARFEDDSYLTHSAGFAVAAEGASRLERVPMPVRLVRSGEELPIALASLPGVEVAIGPSGGVRPDGSAVIGRNRQPFGRTTVLAGESDRWISGDTGASEFVVRTPAGIVTSIIRWPASTRPVTAQDIAEYQATRLARITDPAMAERVREAWTHRPPPPSTMPAFASLDIDSDGNVWVDEYAPPTDNDTNRYQVFDRNGAWLGAVNAPPALRLLEVGSDYVLGVTTTDGAGVVTMHALEKR